MMLDINLIDCCVLRTLVNLYIPSASSAPENSPDPIHGLRLPTC